MSARFANLKSHFAHWREWELNPIVIKELRQGVRNWSVTGMLMLFLVVLFLASLAFLISESFDVGANMELGNHMFEAFVVILAGASVFFIPLYTGVRVAAERQENNLDLLYVTTLSPARIIRGKFLCSAYILLLFFSACMPFMAFTNLLRGVDLPSVFFILAYLYLIVCVANMAAIFFACLPLSRPFKFLFVLAGIFLSFFMVAPLIAFAFESMRSGVGAMMTQRDFWIATLTAVAVALAVIGLFYFLSVALVSPPSANRALPLRIYLTLFWLLGGALAFGWVVQTGNAVWLHSWTAPTFVLMVLALLVTIGNSDHLSVRVRRTIPPRGLLRGLAFLFFNGAAGGLLWVAAIMTATGFAALAMTSGFSGGMGLDEQRSLPSLGAYAFAYSLTALFIQRRFLPNRPPKITALIAILLAGGWALAPAIFLFFANQLSWRSVEGLQLGNIFNVIWNRDESQLIYHEYFAFAWLAVMIVLNARWFWRQARTFRPPEKAPETAVAGVENE